MAIQHPSTVNAPIDISPADFFDNHLPNVVKTHEEVARQLNAIYAFTLTGEDGGEWTVDLPQLEVRRGISENNLHVRMSAEDFQAIMSGKLDAVEAFEKNRVTWEGPPALLGGLAALLRPQDIEL